MADGEGRNIEIVEAVVSGPEPGFSVSGDITGGAYYGCMVIGGEVGLQSEDSVSGLVIEDMAMIGTKTALRGVRGAKINNFYHDAKASEAEQRRAYYEWEQESRAIQHPATSQPRAVAGERRPGENRDTYRKRRKEERRRTR